MGLYVSAHPLAGLKKYFQKKVIPIAVFPTKATSKPIKAGGIIQSFRKITTKKGDMMAILQIEDTTGKVDCVMFPKSYKKNFELLKEDQLILIDGILERRMGEFQVVINRMEGIELEDLQKLAKKEGLWTEGERIETVSRQENEEENIAEAESALEVSGADVKDIDEVKKSSNVYRITVNREVDKEFFLQLKSVLEKHPGDQKVELLIGEKVIPAPMTVAVTDELKGEVGELMG